MTIDADAAWQQVMRRDRSADFFYAVRTTGVFCRPGCASKRPLRKNVEFFATPLLARAAGYRPCQRCKPENTNAASVIERLSKYLREHTDSRVPLAELGRLAGCSPFTAQKSFRAALGVSPAEYQRGLRAKELRRELKNESSITDAVYAAGYGSASRAYEQSPLGMTPGSYKKGGEGEQISYIATQTLLGWLLVATTERGICAVNLGDTKQEVVRALGEEFPRAICSENPALIPALDEVLSTIKGTASAKQSHLPLDLRGTAFQIEVWQALQQIPIGETRSYSQLATELGRPRATRAVARACGQNRLAVVVPCHRVIGANGSLTGYRWGLERKQKLLSSEKIYASKQ